MHLKGGVIEKKRRIEEEIPQIGLGPLTGICPSPFVLPTATQTDRSLSGIQFVRTTRLHKKPRIP